MHRKCQIQTTIYILEHSPIIFDFTMAKQYNMVKYFKGGCTMSIEKVRNYFKKFNIEDRIIEFSTSSATVELAAEAAGCEPARIAKTLSFKVHDDAILIVAAGDAKVDNAKYKHFMGVKAKMLSADEVEPLIGHAIGGVCPFAINPNVKVYLDVSLKRFTTFFPACGSHNSAIELTPEELEKYSENCQGWVDLCKAWQGNA